MKIGVITARSRRAWRVSLAVVLGCAAPMLASANTTNVIPTVFSFEAYTNGTHLVSTNGAGIDGWYGQAMTPTQGAAVVTWMGTNGYVYAKSAGFPLPQATHTNVVRISGAVTNRFEMNNTLTNVWIDCMVQAGRLTGDPDISDDAQVAMYFNTNGHLVVRHGFYTNTFGSVLQFWTELNHEPVGSSDWVRVTIMMDYLSSSQNPYGDLSDVEHYFRVQIDGGGYITNARAYKTPVPLDEVEDVGGSYFLCADSGFGSPGVNNKYFSSFGVEGIGMIDDVVVTNGPVLFTTPTTIAPQWWLDQYGLTTDTTDPDLDGALTWEEYIAGTDPTVGSSVFAVIEQGKLDGSNYVKWIATTNSGVYTKFVIYRATNLVTGWDPVPVATDISRSPDGTNVWVDGNQPPDGVPAFYLPALPAMP